MAWAGAERKVLPDEIAEVKQFVVIEPVQVSGDLDNDPGPANGPHVSHNSDLSALCEL